jgi:hypothetical protein
MERLKARMMGFSMELKRAPLLEYATVVSRVVEMALSMATMKGHQKVSSTDVLKDMGTVHMMASLKALWTAVLLA